MNYFLTFALVAVSSVAALPAQLSARANAHIEVCTAINYGGTCASGDPPFGACRTYPISNYLYRGPLQLWLIRCTVNMGSQVNDQISSIRVNSGEQCKFYM